MEALKTPRRENLTEKLRVCTLNVGVERRGLRVGTWKTTYWQAHCNKVAQCCARSGNAMAFQSVAGVAEVVVRGLVNGQTITNTFYGNYGGTYGQAAITALAAAMDSWVDVELLPLLSSSYSYVECVSKGLENINDYTDSVATSAGPGAVGVDPFPNNVALAISRRSGLTGRSARGRVYIGGLPESILSGGEDYFVTASVNAFVDALNEVRTYMDAADWQEVIVSRWLAGVKRTEGVFFSVTDYVAVDTRVDSRRDRLP